MGDTVLEPLLLPPYLSICMLFPHVTSVREPRKKTQIRRWCRDARDSSATTAHIDQRFNQRLINSSLITLINLH